MVYHFIKTVKKLILKPIQTALKVVLEKMFNINRKSLIIYRWVTCNKLRLNIKSALMNKFQCTSKHKSQLVVRLKIIKCY